MNTTRHTIEKGLLLVGRYITGADGREYLAGVLEYQLLDPNGSPVSLTYRGLATADGAKIVIGDPHRDVRLMDAIISDEPTKRSKDLFDGFCAGIDAKRYPRNPEKRYPNASVDWWDGYNDAWRQKRAA